MEAFAKWRNPDGTYNGAAMLAELSGVPQEEVAWMGRRIVELRDQGVPKSEWQRIVKEEAVTKPWLTK
jgi:hypothetical protein